MMTCFANRLLRIFSLCLAVPNGQMKKMALHPDDIAAIYNRGSWFQRRRQAQVAQV